MMIKNITRLAHITRARPIYQLHSPFFSLKKPLEKIKEFITPRKKSQAEIELDKTVDVVSKGIGGVGGFILGRVMKSVVKSVAKDMQGLNEEMQKIPQVLSRTVSMDDEIKSIVGEFPIIEDLNQTKLALINDKVQFESTCIINGHRRSVQATFTGTRNDADGDYIVTTVQVFDQDGSMISSRNYDEETAPHHKVRVINAKATPVD